MDTSTEILKRLTRKSCTTAWRLFYHRYSTLVKGVAARLGLPEADQQEVLQEPMIAAHRNLNPTGMNGPRARAWLRGVSRRKIMDILRKRYQRKQEVPLQSVREPTHDPHGELDQAWEEEWQAALIERALDRLRLDLPPKMYQAFDLFALRNHDAIQVARTLGIRRSLVYLYKLRVIERLRKEVHRLSKEVG